MGEAQDKAMKDAEVRLEHAKFYGTEADVAEALAEIRALAEARRNNQPEGQ
jgi:hypothetical protein